jgi:SAM-dependent methyltransferase
MMRFEKIQLAGHRLARRLASPCRSAATHLASLTKKIGQVKQARAAISPARKHDLMSMQQVLESLLATSQQISTNMTRLDRKIQYLVDFQDLERNRIRIRVTRGDLEWIISPDIFETFSFREGDLLQVLPEDMAAQLPNSWGDTHIQIQPGKAIRVPSIYKFLDYKGFDIPLHLVTLTGASPETFAGISQSHISNIQKHVGIEPDMRILDIGSGIGSVAFQLLDILDSRGEYIGIDVTRDSIIWCQNNISKKYSNFHFIHFDAVNELYNPYGTKTSNDFMLPAEDSSVDRIILFSVFTHLFRDEVLHYMREFRRVLTPDGLVYASFFHLTPEALEAAKTKRNTEWEPKFDIPLGDGVFANDPVFPRGAVGFTEEAAKYLIDQAGLRLDRPFLKGWWSGLHGEAAEDGQDVMVLRV